MKIVLGSKSPRRQELMKNLGFDIEIRTKEIDEVFPEDMPSEEVAEYLAIQKSIPLKETLNAEELLVTSDTVVLRDRDILGKPREAEDAFNMIKSLCGRKHFVITGVCLATTSKQISFKSSTEVYFEELTDDEITYYIENYKPFDKAGAYGIQEWIGYVGISRINGCYYNVMGLPLEHVYKTIKEEFPEFISLRSR